MAGPVPDAAGVSAFETDASESCPDVACPDDSDDVSSVTAMDCPPSDACMETACSASDGDAVFSCAA